MSDSPLISVRNVARRFGASVALEDMNLAVGRGTIHAVVGESGAGKSALARVLAGIDQPDSGAVEIDGTRVSIGDPGAARKHGIGVALQQSALFPDLPVLANLFVNQEPLRGGLISRREMQARSLELLRQLGLAVDIGAPLAELGPAEGQLVAVARALLDHPRLLVLDEPCESLDRDRRARLFAVLRELKAKGMTVLYLTSRIEEALDLADQITLIRNGRDVLSKPRLELTASEEGMIGQLRQTLFPLPLRSLTNVAGSLRPQLAIAGLAGGNLAGLDLAVRAGEIVGLAGLVDSGAQDLFTMLFGQRKARKGRVRFPDGHALPRSRNEAARRGIGVVASQVDGRLMADKSVAFNLSSVVVGARDWGSRWFLPQTALERAARQIEALRIRAAPLEQAGSLPAGARRKLAIANWLEIGPQVLLLDDPARGVDISSKQEIYSLIRQIAASGCVVLLYSTEPSELTSLCDRILALRQGWVVAELAGTDMDPVSLRRLITGDPASPDEQPMASQRNAA